MNNSVNSGYSKKYKVYHQKNLYTDEKHRNSPHARVKLSPLSPDSFKSKSSDKQFNFASNQLSLPKNKLVKIIDEHEKDYEQAIQQHLGIRGFSRESNHEENSPLTKIYINSPTRFASHSDTTPENSLISVELKELQLSSDIQGLEKRSKQLKSKIRNLSEVARFDLDDSKLAKLKSSIKDVRTFIVKQKKSN
jgi:hypothetical protein